LRTVNGGLWCALEGTPGHTVVLYPYLEGENAMVAGMSEDQWREFGVSLRAVHDSAVGDQFQHLLPTETFALPSAALVRKILAHAQSASEMEGVAQSLAEFWRHQASRIEWMLDRAESLGRQLQEQPFEMVLCHSDIHAANILVGLDGQIHLIDWDGPLRAPRERDMIFVIGSRIARTVQSQEERWFFEGYGRVEVDPTALSYFRYERIIEDIGEFGKSVFSYPDLSEEVRRKEMELTIGLFETGGDIDRAEQVAHGNRP
jgi:spectinomycin phosphotransferase